MLLATSVCRGQGEACALQQLAEQPALAHWLETLRTSSRLAPLNEKLVIVASSATAAGVIAWAEQHGLGPCVCVSCDAAAAAPGPGSTSSSEVADVLLACQQPALQSASHITVVDSSKVLEPGTSIALMVEAALIRAAPATAGVCIPLDVPPGVPLAPTGCESEVELASRMEQSSRLLAVRPSSVADPAARRGGADGIGGGAPTPATRFVLAPVCVVARQALMERGAAAGTLAGLVEQLMGEGKVVRSWRMEVRD